MNRIFGDAGFVIALINNRDQYHEQASDMSSRYEQYPVLITDAILLEIGNALALSHRSEAADIIEYFLTSDEAEVVHLTPQLFEQALAEYKRHQDKTWGLVDCISDCISFVVMREAGIAPALTFDRQFEQAGFRPMMREE